MIPEVDGGCDVTVLAMVDVTKAGLVVDDSSVDVGVTLMSVDVAVVDN